MFGIEIDWSELINLMAPPKDWTSPGLNKHMPKLGEKIVRAMKYQISRNKYTGALDESINYSWDEPNKTLTIGPNAKRKSFDAGMILQKGTREIQDCPWRPIQMWGQFRGLTQKESFGVLLKIRASGVSAHPFLVETLQRGDVKTALDEAALLIGDDLAASVWAGNDNLASATFGVEE